MKRPTILSSICMLLFFACLSFGQQLKPLAFEVQKKHQQKTRFTKIDNLLSVQQNSTLSSLVEKEVRDAQLFNYNKTLASEIINNRYPALTFNIELDNELKTIEVVLVKQSFHDYIVSSSSGTIPETTSNRGIHYRGIVLGDENSSLVAISIFKNELIGVISTPDKGDYSIGKLKNHDEHIVYNEENLLETPTFECLSDLNSVEKPTTNYGNFTESNNPEDYCINVYFEVDNEIYVNRGSSIANTEAFVTGLFNQTAAIYQNESITVQISEIFVWDTPDSYNNTDIIDALIQFQIDKPVFNGDLAQLLEFGTTGGSGIAYGIGGLCEDPSIALPYAATSLFPDFALVPLYSRQVKVLTHEMGHNFNSRHTHACVWNGNNTTYDDYGNYFNNGSFQSNSEGATCVNQANPKLNETPTIMSYYDSRGFGTFPMSNGFGDQPGDVVRAKVLSANCLSLCIPANCNTVISSFPYNESFEADLGDWEQGSNDDFDWTRKTGSTSSYQTGPPSASDGSFYAYVESSSPNYPSKTTILNSPCFDLSGQSIAQLSFAYHMYGASMGTLDLQVSSDGGTTWTTEWSLSGDQGYQWYTAGIDLGSYTGHIISLRFVGTTATSYQSDIAIDDISITNGSCNATITSFPYTESFESSMNDWEQSSGDDFDWTRNSGPTTTDKTGPKNAAEGNYYAYIEASAPNSVGKTAILESPCFDLSGQSDMQLIFVYNMFGESIGTLDVQVSDDGGTTWVSEWSRSGFQGTLWYRTSIDLSAYAGSVISVRFVGTTAINPRGDIAIDDIIVSSKSCHTTVSSFPYTESFETSLGEWQQSAEDDFDWIRNSGGTPSNLTGPTGAADGTYYAYVEASRPNSPFKTTLLTSPCFNLSLQQSATLDFAYHMYGEAMGTLNLQASNDGGTTWTSIWSISGDQGTQWNSATVDLTSYAGGTVQLRFNGFTGSAPNSHRGDMIIDGIVINTVAGPGGNNGDTWMGDSNSPMFTIYPNPAQNYAIVDVSELNFDEITISVVDLLGKEMYSAKTNDGDTPVRISTDNFAIGTYMVVVKANTGELFNKKLIVKK